MSRKAFQLPDAESEQPRAGRDAERTALVGGSVEMRRRHGHPSQLSGEFVRDPIFDEAHLQELKDWCAPDPDRPLVVEVGFQRGRFAARFCRDNPDVRYLGFEVRRVFCEDADAWLVKHGIDNARLALVDAREMLTELIEPGTLDAIFCFFPDPWWKRKHMKKRLVTASFAALVRDLLTPAGRFVVKTDVQGYAEWAAVELGTVAGLSVERLTDPGAGLPMTQRERRCGLRGLPTWALQATRS